MDTHRIELTLALTKAVEEHPFWQNPVVAAFKNISLSLTDMRVLLFEYYFWANTLPRLYAQTIANCDIDHQRDKLLRTMLQYQRHQLVMVSYPERLRHFLIECLGLPLEYDNNMKAITRLFIENSIQSYLMSTASESLAMLAFVTEGVIERLYSLLVTNLKALNFSHIQLHYFYQRIHDDSQYLTALKEVAVGFCFERYWLERCKFACAHALDMHNQFFHQLYELILEERIGGYSQDALRSSIAEIVANRK